MKQRRQKRVRAIRRRLDTIRRREATKKIQLVLVLLASLSQSLCQQPGNCGLFLNRFSSNLAKYFLVAFATLQLGLDGVVPPDLDQFQRLFSAPRTSHFAVLATPGLGA